MTMTATAGVRDHPSASSSAVDSKTTADGAANMNATPTSAATTTPHPLSPLSATELTAAAALVRSQWPPTTDLRFKILTLAEPDKKALAPYIDAEHRDPGQGLGGRRREMPEIPRRAFAAYYIRNTVGSPFPFHFFSALFRFFFISIIVFLRGRPVRPHAH